MAIEIAATTPYGIDLPSAYMKINQIVVDARTVMYSVRTFADADARKAEKHTLDEKSFSFSNDAKLGNVMNACYEDLMSRPEYEGAVAV